MKLTTNGKNKIPFMRKRMLLCMFACACIFSSCVQKETITDVYYIHNDCSQSVVLDFYHLLFWDTCSIGDTATYTYVQFATRVIEIPSGKTIRLHPICRTKDNPEAHQLNATVFGSKTILIYGTDTITWHSAWKNRLPSQVPCMFTDESVWSIFNTLSWQTQQDDKLPYTYYHTFSITETDIERNKAL